MAEVDLVLDATRNAKTDARDERDNSVPPVTDHAVTQIRDVWAFGRHRLICGDAQGIGSYNRLLEGESVDLPFTDPPYNVPINGHNLPCRRRHQLTMNTHTP